MFGKLWLSIRVRLHGLFIFKNRELDFTYYDESIKHAIVRRLFSLCVLIIDHFVISSMSIIMKMFEAYFPSIT